MMAQTAYTTTSAIWGGLFSDPQDKRINRTGGSKRWTGGRVWTLPNPRQFPHWQPVL